MQNSCAPELTVLEVARLLEAFGTRLRCGLRLEAKIHMGESLLIHRQIDGNARQHKPILVWDEDGTAYELPHFSPML